MSNSGTQVIEYSLSCNLPECLGCLFLLFYLLGWCFSGKVQICTKFKYASTVLLGNQQQVRTHGRKVTLAEVNISLIQQASIMTELDNHFIKWIVSTCIQTVNLVVSKIQTVLLGVFTFCALVEAVYHGSFPL